MVFVLWNKVRGSNSDNPIICKQTHWVFVSYKREFHEKQNHFKHFFLQQILLSKKKSLEKVHVNGWTLLCNNVWMRIWLGKEFGIVSGTSCWNKLVGSGKYTLLKKIKGTWSAPSLVCGHSQVQLLEDMHNCTSLKSVMFKKTIDFTCNEFDTTLAPL